MSPAYLPTTRVPHTPCNRICFSLKTRICIPDQRAFLVAKRHFLLTSLKPFGNSSILPCSSPCHLYVTRSSFNSGGFFGRRSEATNLDLELEIFRFMQSSKQPNVFPTKQQLIEAGREDLVQAVQSQGGWLAAGWESNEKTTDGRPLPPTTATSPARTKETPKSKATDPGGRNFLKELLGFDPQQSGEEDEGTSEATGGIFGSEAETQGRRRRVDDVARSNWKLRDKLREMSGDPDRMPSVSEIRAKKQVDLERRIERRGGWQSVARLFGLGTSPAPEVRPRPQGGSESNQSEGDVEEVPSEKVWTPGVVPARSAGGNNDHHLAGGARGQKRVVRSTRQNPDSLARDARSGSGEREEIPSRWRWRRPKATAGNVALPAVNSPSAVSHDAKSARSKQPRGGPAVARLAEPETGNARSAGSGKEGSARLLDARVAKPESSSARLAEEAGQQSSARLSDAGVAKPETSSARLAEEAGQQSNGRVAEVGPRWDPIGSGLSILNRIKALELNLLSERSALKFSQQALMSQTVLETEKQGRQVRQETVKSLVDVSESLEFRENDILRSRREIRRTRAEVVALEGKLAAECREARKALEGGAELQTWEDNAMAVPVRLTRVVWPNHGKEVKVMGSFDSWKEKIQMERSNAGVFVANLQLAPGKYEIKFIVDGVWKVDPHRPIVYSGGNENNLLVIN